MEQAIHPEAEVLYAVSYDSPLGNLKITGSDKGIVSVLFTDDLQGKQSPAAVLPGMQECIRQLDEYFAGKRRTFYMDFDLRGTEFQKKVWNELLNIPYGKTISYLELARRLGDEKVIRAAGTANGKNPLAIIIPCHRVIGSDGKLVGYAGGMHRKQWLLEFEKGEKQGELF